MEVLEKFGFGTPIDWVGTKKVGTQFLKFF